MALTGVAAASWQAFGPIDPAGCSLTLADRIVQSTTLDVRLPLIFSATANCDEANVPLLGIPFAVWSMLSVPVLVIVPPVSPVPVAMLVTVPVDVPGGTEYTPVPSRNFVASFGAFGANPCFVVLTLLVVMSVSEMVASLIV